MGRNARKLAVWFDQLVTGLRLIWGWITAPEQQRFLATLAGAAGMHIFSLTKGFQGAEAWLRRMWPTKSDAWYARADFVCVVVFGTVVGQAFFGPDTVPKALAAGLGWVGAANIMLSPRQTQ